LLDFPRGARENAPIYSRQDLKRTWTGAGIAAARGGMHFEWNALLMKCISKIVRNTYWYFSAALELGIF